MKQAKKKRPLWQKICGIVVVILLLLVGVGAVYLHQSTYSATEAALKQSQQAIHEKHYDLYSNGKENQFGVIFYPGALVKPESYSEWASQVAEAGYDVYVLHLPLNLAIFAPDAPEKIIEEHPKQKFVLAGHSLGGVIASRYAAEHAKQVTGMIFLASYPDEKGSLKNTTLPVLSITASNDGVLDQATYQSAKKYLPEQTQYQQIKGGNHAGFGTYGPQKGDKQATITNQTQQQELSRMLIEWLGKLTKEAK